ncbi:MAG TPA: LysE family transporter [Actinomycetota bacterium]|jgi:threonine/homoserine/homoserine lactone efflux protein|nr:LysE family transporter [Actinomycetota bacterium]
MSVGGAGVGAAFALGFALGAAPGPVQLLILSETAKRGLEGGLRVMLGANLTLLGILVILALGFASLKPGPGVIRTLQAVGGSFLLWIGVVELRSIRDEARSTVDAPSQGAVARLGPTTKGVAAVLLNPGAWIFFATTASALMADATSDGGTGAALAAAVAMAVGVSCSDLTFTILGSGGRRLFGERGLRWIRMGLAALLVAIGVAFVTQAIRG